MNATQRKSDRLGILAPPPLIYLGSLGLGVALERVSPTRPADWGVAAVLEALADR